MPDLKCFSIFRAENLIAFIAFQILRKEITA